VQEKISFKVKLEEQREKLEMIANENGTLKEKFSQQEEEIKSLKKRIKTLNN
jgi:predicted nuclease with TOPRIM domain